MALDFTNGAKGLLFVTGCSKVCFQDHFGQKWAREKWQDYRVGHLLANLGLVDLDLEYYTIQYGQYVARVAAH